jgi:Replication-relaxation
MITNPTPQRALRGHLPPRIAPRAAATAEHHAHLAQRLQPRDRWLARMLSEHKVFTSHQITQLAWPSIRAANLRLLQLYRWRVIDRFQPFVTLGSAPMHYVLDIAGATALAHEDGLDLTDLDYRHDREIGRAYSLRLAHTTGTNGVFTALIAHARHHPGTTVTAWWSEARCARHFGDVVRPDAYGRWHEADRELEFFLEFDFGTENLRTLATKLTGYERLAATTSIITPVLVWLPTTRRETGARGALATALRALDRPHLVPLATTSSDFPDPARALDPTAARWLPIGAPRDPGRLRLVDLARSWPGLSTPFAGSASSAPSSRTATAAATPAGLLPPSPMPPDQPPYQLSR